VPLFQLKNGTNLYHELLKTILHKNVASMKKNMGNVDRLIRLAIVVFISILSFTKFIEGTLSIVLLAISAIFLLTSFISFCPLYTLFGVNTCKKK
jgi:predicted Na+-dependent transporter